MLKAGDNVDRYVIDSLLGEGGMGAVYRAHDPRIDRAVAVKIVHVAVGSTDASRADATARLLREARAAAKIDHANAINIYDVGETAEGAFIVMELVDGRTLRACLDDGSLSYAEKLRVLTDVARALAAAHRAGIVHRDVKPDNIMIRRDGVVKVLDFGIARRAAGAIDASATTESDGILTLTAAGVAVGTPLYMTPEQIRGEPLDGRSDQFAWGVVAWETLAGKLPWSARGDAMALAGAILTQPAAPLASVASSVDSAVEAIVMRSLAKSPSDRFASMNDVVTALEKRNGNAQVASGSAASTGPTASSAAGTSTAGSAAAGNSAVEPQMSAVRSPARVEAKWAFAHYSTEQMRAIIGRALERQAEAGTGGYDREDVLAAAREVGVDDATLRAAEREVLEQDREGETRTHGDDDEPSGGRGREWRRLVRHFVAYAAVFTFCVATMGWRVGKWVLFGWGIGVVIHAIKVVLPDQDSTTSRAARALRGGRRERKGRVRRANQPTEEIERRASELLATAASHRVRVHSSVPARISESAPREPELEAESTDAAETGARERRRRS